MHHLCWCFCAFNYRRFQLAEVKTKVAQHRNQICPVASSGSFGSLTTIQSCNGTHIGRRGGFSYEGRRAIVPLQQRHNIFDSGGNGRVYPQHSLCARSPTTSPSGAYVFWFTPGGRTLQHAHDIMLQLLITTRHDSQSCCACCFCQSFCKSLSFINTMPFIYVNFTTIDFTINVLLGTT